MIDEATTRLLQVAVASSYQHDITLARQQTTPLPLGSLCLVDSGYQGLGLDGCRVVWPFKKPRQRELEPEQKAFNQHLAQVRVKVEHAIRRLKVFRLLKGIYRGRRRGFERRLMLIAGLVNRNLEGQLLSQEVY